MAGQIKSDNTDLVLNADGSGSDVKFQSNGSEVASIDQAGVLAAGGATLTGNITHAGDLTLDVGGDISLDADGGDILLKDGGTTFGTLSNDGGYFDIKSTTSNQDISIKGNDGGSTVTAVRFDMSDAGKAIFNNGVAIGGTAAANTLGDYEEGYCSIAFSDGTNTEGSTNNFVYTKVGRLVTVSGSVSSSGFSNLTGSETLRLSGFPFTTFYSGSFPIFTRNLDSPDNTHNVVGYYPNNQSAMQVWFMIDHGNYHQATCEDFHATANDMYFTVSYMTTQ